MTAPRLALGTANWGVSYGAPGLEVEVGTAMAGQLARHFLSDGHDVVDTASAYGRAEELVGRAFAGARPRVVTKLAAMDAADGVVERVRRSASRAGVDRFAAVLLHDHAAALADPRQARSVMAAVRDSGLTDRVGVSVYTPAEATAAVELLGADIVQLPSSVADQRFVGGCIGDLTARGVEVHVRSIFLNGVLLSRPEELTGRLRPLASAVRRIWSAAAAAGRTPLELAVTFARDVTGADAVVVGAVTVAQLDEILSAWRSGPALPAGAEWRDLTSGSSEAIDPRTWRL